jgi:hypothetical protein
MISPNQDSPNNMLSYEIRKQLPNDPNEKSYIGV